MGAERLGGILNDDEAVALGYRHQAGHVGHVAEHMHDLQRLDVCTGLVIVQPVLFQGAVVGTKILHGVRVNAKGIVAADEDRFRAHIAGQRVDGGDEGQRRDDDLIPAGDAGGHSGQMQRAGTGVAGHGAGHAHISGQRFLKLRDLAAAGGHPPRRDGLPGQLGLARAEIRNRKRNKFRHDTASKLYPGARRAAADGILQIFYFIIPRLQDKGKKKMRWTFCTFPPGKARFSR